MGSCLHWVCAHLLGRGVLLKDRTARLPSFIAAIGTRYFERDDGDGEDDDGGPSTMDEAFDAESLHASMRLRRVASETSGIAAGCPRRSFGLFTPAGRKGVCAYM